MVIPRNSETLSALNFFNGEYGAGMVLPFYVVFNKTIPGKKDTLLENEEAFELMGEMARTFLEESKIEFTGEDEHLRLSIEKMLAPFFLGKELSIREF